MNIRIVDFNYDHLEKAKAIALENYEEEKGHIPILPELDEIPDLKIFADNGLGVAALEGNRLLGYLGAWPPREDAFGTTGVKGTFVPIHAHGVLGSIIGAARERIYSKMYQAAALKWVNDGILSHGISLYAHDLSAIKSFYYNGFGLRCIDAIRPMDEMRERLIIHPQIGVTVDNLELPREEWGKLLEFINGLRNHLGSSPIFMRFPMIKEEELYSQANSDTRYFAAKAEGRYIAYIKVDKAGETFISEHDSMLNISGAYCNPDYRGSGVYHNLLSYLVATLKKEGYTRLGVDMESFNPNARGFWLKYFSEYTQSLVRRIDDKAVMDCWEVSNGI